MSNFTEIFNQSTLYENGNDSPKYETYRQTREVVKKTLLNILEEIDANIYYDRNTGQCCFNENYNIEDLEKFIEEFLG